MKLISRMSIFRHGETDYNEYKNGKRPDLTRDGIKNIIRIADDLSFIYDGHEKPQFVFISSPAFRTIDSIETIKKQLKCEGTKTIIENLLRPIELRDRQKAEIIFRNNVDYSDIPYTRDPIFDDSSLFEPREEIRQRFYSFLSGIFKKDIKNPNKTHKIICTHYEILYHFAQNIFGLNYNRGDKTLKCGEVVDVWAYERLIPHLIYMDIKFRGFWAKQIPYDYTKKKLIL